MAGLNLTNAAGALKKFYLPGSRNTINNKTKLLTRIQRGAEHVEGEEWVLSLHLRRNSGVGSRGENDTSPTAGNQLHVQARDSVKEVRGRIEITTRAIKAMASNKGSFARAVDSEMQGVTQDCHRNLNRQFAGDGTGKIATCGTTTASTTVVLATTTFRSALLQLEVGMVVDIGTVASPTLRASAREITSIDRSAKTFVISGAAITTAATDFVFVSGAAGVETHGLQEIVKATGTLFNVNPTTYPEWVSYVSDASSGPINDPLLEAAADEADLLTGEEIDLWLTSYPVYRAYGNYLSVMKRANSQELNLKGGHKGLSVASGSDSAVLMRERDIPDDQAYGLNSKHLFAPEMSDWDFMDEDGSVFSRVKDKNAYEATLYKFIDLATDHRAAHVLVDNISV